MKKLLLIAACVVIFILVISLAKDTIIKVSVENGVRLVTGLPLKIQSFKVGIAKTLVDIKGMKLYNPKGYPDKIMLDIPEVYVDYNLSDIIKGKIHLEEMRINLEEFIVVKNQNGELNLDSLKVAQAQKTGEGPEKKGKARAPDIQIDSLGLKIGKVIYKDYSKGPKPSVQEFNVNLNEKYTNITNPHSLVSLIVVKALMNTTIVRLTNFDLGGLKGAVSDTLASTQKIAVEGAQKAQEAVKQTTEALKKTTEELKDVFQLPFGGKQKE